MKCLSVKQPNATLICSGVKKVENRTWSTKFRGRILIHASSDSYAWPDFDHLPLAAQEIMRPYDGIDDLSDAPEMVKKYGALLRYVFDFYHLPFDIHSDLKWLRPAVKKYGYALPAQAIVGEVDIIDIVDNSIDPFALSNSLHWVLDNAILYEKPIINVVGKLRLWNFDKE
jgi:hypothetical protein